MIPDYTAINFTLGVRGTRGLAANFYAADRDILQAMRDLTKRGAQLIVDVTRQLAPVRTGFMRDHVAYELLPSGLGYEAGWRESDFTAAGLPFYPLFQELGTRFMAANPSLGPAAQYVAPILLHEGRDILRAAIERLEQRGRA